MAEVGPEFPAGLGSPSAPVLSVGLLLEHNPVNQETESKMRGRSHGVKHRL